MIHYELRCSAAHEFDAWFRSSASFDDQSQAGLLSCPHCGERRVTRALMAPALPRARRKPPATESAPVQAEPSVPASARVPAGTELATTPSPPQAGPVAVRGDLPPMPDHVRAALQRLRSEVERRCDYVGGNFAAEARRIHEGESTRRSIYGEATPAEAEALAEDGIEVAQIPWLPRADA